MSDRKAYQREYYRKKKEERKAYFKEYYEKNKDRIKARNNKHYAESKELQKEKKTKSQQRLLRAFPFLKDGMAKQDKLLEELLSDLKEKITRYINK